MRLTKGMNFAFEVQSEDHGTIHVHTTPIARVTFEAHFMELKAAFDACFNANDPMSFVTSGPRIAYAALKAASIRAGTWEVPKGTKNAPTTVQDGLIAELIRLTSVSIASDGEGWKSMGMSTAIAREILDDESHYEILGILCFFCSASRAGPRDLVEGMLTMMETADTWQFGSWNSTEFAASLPISTPPESTTMKPFSGIA